MCTVKDITVVTSAYCLCPSWSFGIPGCGVLNCLEETWEERGHGEKRKEAGGRKDTVWCGFF